MLRRLIGVAGEIAELGYDEPDDVTKALDNAETKVFELADRRVSRLARSPSATCCNAGPQRPRAGLRAGHRPHRHGHRATSISTSCSTGSSPPP